MDSLKAEVEATPAAPEKLVHTYLWKVNDRVIEEAVGDTLNLSAFHKRDLVTVTVTPYDGETAGLAVASSMVAIHSVPPSLELNAMRRARKPENPSSCNWSEPLPTATRSPSTWRPPRFWHDHRSAFRKDLLAPPTGAEGSFPIRRRR